MEHKTLNQLLQSVLDTANGGPMTIREIFLILKHRGLALFIVIFSAPFLFPFQIPGLSIPFGIGIFCLGLQVANPRREVFPNWLLKKELSYATLKKWIERTSWILEKVNRFVYHRLEDFVHKRSLLHINGLLVSFFSIVYVLPIPLPFTNFLASIPIFLIGLGLIEEDGLIICLAYILSVFCAIGFVAVIYYGYEGAEWLGSFF